MLAVVSDSPAAKAGIEAQDLVTEIDSKSVKGMPADEAGKLLTGRPGTTVGLTLKRGDDKPRQVTLTRAEDVMRLGFKDLEKAAYSPGQRQLYEGRVVELLGQFQPGRDAKTFSLVRIKITCCAADAVPLNVLIMLDPHSKDSLSKVSPNQWVKVHGRVEFRKRLDTIVPIIVVPESKNVEAWIEDPNPYN